MDNFLTYLIFIPLIAAVPTLLLRGGASRIAALAATIAELFVTLALYARAMTAPQPGRWLLVVDTPWIEGFGARYSLGLDGISLLLVTLTSLLFVLSVGVSWRSVRERVPLFHFMLLLMEAGVMGVFLSTDLFLFYLFWELMLVPMFFIIGVWGHGRKVYSAVKFFIFTVTGSLLMLVAIIGLYIAHAKQAGGVYTFALGDLMNTALSPTTSMMFFAAFALAFFVKVPVFPLHTWLPDAHTDAPTAGSVILAGLMLKTGTYGMLRFGVPLFPKAAAACLPFIFGLGLIGVFYAAWISYAQTDMKRLVAYSSISHLGFVIIGIAAWNDVSLAGATLQMVNHGITTGALFMMVGMMDERTHTRELSAYGGLWGRAPVMSSFFLLFVLSSLGLPGLNNFVGEFMILVGVFRDEPRLAAVTFIGVVTTLIYLLRLAQKVLFGPRGELGDFADLSFREVALLAPLAILVIAIGLYPSIALRPLDAPVHWLLMDVKSLASIPAGGLP